MHSPKFRPDTRLPGGSASAGVPRGGPVPRAMPSRRLRLGGGRRRDGVFGGGVLARGGRGGRGRPARAVSLRLGSGRRGDGAVGGLPGGRRLWAGTRLAAQRRAAPRFRSGAAAAGGHSVLGRRTRLGAGKRARFNPGRSSLLAAWTGGRLGGRSTGLADWQQADRRIPMIPASRRRLAVLHLIVASLLIGLGARLWFVQVMSGTAYASQAKQEQTETVIVPSVRGEILDDTGSPMVDNRSALVVSVSVADLQQQPDGGVAEMHRLAALLGLSYQRLSEETRICTAHVSQPCWPGSPYQPIPVAQNVPDQVAVQVMESQNEFPGVTAQVQPVTNYVQPIATDAAQTLGYLQPITSQEMQQRGLPDTGFSGVDLVGQSGLESEYDQQLRGTIGDKVVSVNAGGPGDRHGQVHPGHGRRRPGDQHQRHRPAGHRERARERDPEDPGRGQLRRDHAAPRS